MFYFSSYLVLFISSTVDLLHCLAPAVLLHPQLPQSLIKDTLSNLGIHFPLHNGKLTSSRGSKAAPNHDAPSVILQCFGLIFSSWYVSVCCFFVFSSTVSCFRHHDTQGLLRSLLLGMIHQQMLPVKSIKMFFSSK